MNIKFHSYRSVRIPVEGYYGKMKNHLGYLCETFNIESLFDSCMKNETKEKIIKNLKNREGQEISNLIMV